MQSDLEVTDEVSHPGQGVDTVDLTPERDDQDPSVAEAQQVGAFPDVRRGGLGCDRVVAR
jgi:hypothetical protein